MQARLAALYLPIIGITMETLPQLYDPCLEVKLRSGFSLDEEGDRISQRVAMAIAGSSVSGRSMNPSHSTADDHSSGSKVEIIILFCLNTKKVDFISNKNDLNEGLEFKIYFDFRFIFCESTMQHNQSA